MIEIELLEDLISKLFDINLEMTILSSRMSDYPTITQGKTRIPGINDGEEFEETDVSQTILISKGMVLNHV